jgi:hypothetical protein
MGASQKLWDELVMGAAAGDLARVKSFLAKAGPNGYSAPQLSYALAVGAKSGSVAVCKALLDAGAPVTPPPSKPNGPDDLAWRPPDMPLNLGAQRQHLDVCKFLLDAGADPNATDSWGNSLSACCSAEPADPKVVTLLLERGADPTAAVDRLVEWLTIDYGNDRSARAVKQRAFEVLPLLAPRVPAAKERIDAAIAKARTAASGQKKRAPKKIASLAIDDFGERSLRLWLEVLTEALPKGDLVEITLGALDEDILFHELHVEILVDEKQEYANECVGWPDTALPATVSDYDDCEPLVRFLEREGAEDSEDEQDELYTILRAAHDREIAARVRELADELRTAGLSVADTCKLQLARHDSEISVDAKARGRALIGAMQGCWSEKAAKVAELLYGSQERRQQFLDLVT